MKAISRNTTYAPDYMQAVFVNEDRIEQRRSNRKFHRRKSRRNLLIITTVYFAMLAFLLTYLIF